MSSPADASKDWIQYLKTVDTPTLSNAIELLNLRSRDKGFTHLQLRCLFPELGRMCGYAVTAQVETMTEAAETDWSVFLRLYEAVAQSSRPAVIAFQEIGPHAEYAVHCGEVMATIFTRLGSVGLISDCAVRDIPEVRAMGFKYFARGVAASHAYFRIVRVGVPIQVCGLPICSGDIIHGDENGLLLVPRQALDGLSAAVDKVRSREGMLMEFVRSADFSLSKLRMQMLE